MYDHSHTIYDTIMVLCNYVFQETGNLGLVISMRSCRANIVQDYSNRDHVFRLVTAGRSAYLFEADSSDVMLDWICAVKKCSLSNNKEVS